MTHRKFLLFGLQRSGTNFVEELISSNFDVDFHEYSFWKHGYNLQPDDLSITQSVPVIVVYKSPHKWIESVTRTPKGISRHYDVYNDNNTDQNDIIIGVNDDKEVRSMRNRGVHMINRITGEKIKPEECQIDSNNEQKYDLKKLVALWNDFYNYWLNVATPNFFFIRFRNIIMHPDKYMTTLSRFYGLESVKTQIGQIPRIVRESNYVFSDKHKDDYIKFKLNILTPEQAQRINQHVDIKLINRLGLELF